MRDDRLSDSHAERRRPLEAVQNCSVARLMCVWERWHWLCTSHREERRAATGSPVLWEYTLAYYTASYWRFERCPQRSSALVFSRVAGIALASMPSSVPR